MEYLFEYLQFLAEVVTIIGGIVVVVILVASLSGRQGHAEQGQLVVRSVNDRLDGMRETMESALLPEAELKKKRKAEKKERKAQAKGKGKD